MSAPLRGDGAPAVLGSGRRPIGARVTVICPELGVAFSVPVPTSETTLVTPRTVRKAAAAWLCSAIIAGIEIS